MKEAIVEDALRRGWPTGVKAMQGQGRVSSTPAALHVRITDEGMQGDPIFCVGPFGEASPLPSEHEDLVSVCPQSLSTAVSEPP